MPSAICQIFSDFVKFVILRVFRRMKQQQNIGNEENICYAARGCREITSLSLAQKEIWVGRIRVASNNIKVHRIRRSVNQLSLVIRQSLDKCCW